MAQLYRLLCRFPTRCCLPASPQPLLRVAASAFTATSHRPLESRPIHSAAHSPRTMADKDDDSNTVSPTEPASPTAASPTSPPPRTIINPAAYNLDDAERAALATSAPAPLTVLSYNVNSLRTLTRRLQLPSLAALLDLTHADILCLQETKASAFSDLPVALLRVAGYDSYWAFDTVHRGRNGVVTYARCGLTCEAREGVGWGSDEAERAAGGVDWTAEEGRVVTTDHTAFVLFNIYFPNAGRGDERLAYKMRFYAAVEERVRQLRAQGREVVVVGDVNTAHRPIDIHNPKIKSTGFLPIEREWMDKVLLPELPPRPAADDEQKQPAADGEGAVQAVGVGGSDGPLLVDVWRWLHGDRVQYSFWDQKTSARARNRGWRIDYILVSPNLTAHLLTAAMHPEMQASDHSPVAAYFAAPIARQAAAGASSPVRLTGRNRAIDGSTAKGLEDAQSAKGRKGGAGGGVRDGKQKSISSFFDGSGGGGGGGGGSAVADVETDGGAAESAETADGGEQAEDAAAAAVEADADKAPKKKRGGAPKRRAESAPAARKRGKK